MSITAMKNKFGFSAVTLFSIMLCFGCSIFGDYSFDHIDHAEQSGNMFCLVKKRYSAAYKVRSPLTKGELFLRGDAYKSEEFPNLVVRNCSALTDKLMALNTDQGGIFWYKEDGEPKMKRFDLPDSQVVSNDMQWFVTQDKRINMMTNEEIPFKQKLPSEFLGNSPDWKTIITEGENLVEQDLISLYVMDVETGAAQKRYVRRSKYLFMLDRSHQLHGVVANNLWISNQFRWVADAGSEYQLVYPVLEPVETTKSEK